MVGGAMNPKRAVLSPNWAQLQQKLNAGRLTKPSNPSLPASEAPKSPHSAPGKRKERPDLDVTSSSSLPPSSILTPVSTDCSLTNAIAMDCEMVGVSSQGNKSALGRVTMVNTWGNVIYDEYVRPLEWVVDFRTRISGIRPKNLRKAKEFNVVQKQVAELIKGRILVGHALHNDLKVLLLSHPKKDTRDTSEFQPFLREGRSRALRDLAFQILGIKIQQDEHCSIEDARAAMLIYQKNKKGWERSIKKQFWVRKKLKKHNNQSKDSAGPDLPVVTS